MGEDYHRPFRAEVHHASGDRTSIVIVKQTYNAQGVLVSYDDRGGTYEPRQSGLGVVPYFLPEGGEV
jgi:hypothetical protein